MPNNYSRNTYDRHPDKIERNHLCPLCGAYVLPFLGVLGTEHKGHCPHCGTVTYVSMPETVTFEFTSYIRAELEQERTKALQIVLDVATQDQRIARRASILDAFRDEPMSKAEAAELYSELAEIDQALQFHPSDTCQDYISAAWDKNLEEVKF